MDGKSVVSTRAGEGNLCRLTFVFIGQAVDLHFRNGYELRSVFKVNKFLSATGRKMRIIFKSDERKSRIEAISCQSLCPCEPAFAKEGTSTRTTSREKMNELRDATLI